MAGRAAGHPFMEWVALNPNLEVITTVVHICRALYGFEVFLLTICHLIDKHPGGRGGGGRFQSLWSRGSTKREDELAWLEGI